MKKQYSLSLWVCIYAILTVHTIICLGYICRSNSNYTVERKYKHDQIADHVSPQPFLELEQMLTTVWYGKRHREPSFAGWGCSHPSPVHLPSLLIVIRDSHRESKCMRFQFIEKMFDLYIYAESILIEVKDFL